MTNPSTDDSLDIQALGAKAHHALQKVADQDGSGGALNSSGRSFFFWLKLVLVAGLAVFFLSQADGLRRQLFGVSQATTQLEAQAVLKSARAAVEQHRKETGALPDRVPLAALEALVTLEHTGTDYQLKIVLDGKTWTMDHNDHISGESK